MGFGRIFEEIFGFRSQARSKSVEYGQDIALDTEIELEDAFHGFEKEVDLNIFVSCPKCQGQGGENLQECQTCNGTGYEQERSQSILGILLRQKVCSQCQGRGNWPEKICSQCQGQGRVKDIKKVKINIPAGIEDGHTLRLSGQGEVGPYNGPAGDIFVNIHIKPHKHFQRQGDDLIYKLPISFTQAALGDKIKIPVIDGQTELKIPAGIQSEEVIKLKGQGMPNLYDRRQGELIVKIHVLVPKRLNRQQKQLIEELKKEEKSYGFKKFFG